MWIYRGRVLGSSSVCSILQQQLLLARRKRFVTAVGFFFFTWSAPQGVCVYVVHSGRRCKNVGRADMGSITARTGMHGSTHRCRFSLAWCFSRRCSRGAHEGVPPAMPLHPLPREQGSVRVGAGGVHRVGAPQARGTGGGGPPPLSILFQEVRSSPFLSCRTFPCCFVSARLSPGVAVWCTVLYCTGVYVCRFCPQEMLSFSSRAGRRLLLACTPEFFFIPYRWRPFFVCSWGADCACILSSLGECYRGERDSSRPPFAGGLLRLPTPLF